MYLIVVEGNIGVGKSTITTQLSEVLPNAMAFYEPVEKNPYLDDYYKDPKRWALEMQFWLMAARFDAHREALEQIYNTHKTVIMDRSIYGDWIFAKKNWLDGNINDRGYASYMKHRDVMDKYLMPPHLVLYLDASPNICKERISMRGRSCEQDISLSYLEGLHDLHRELMLDMEQRGSIVLRHDWSQFSPITEVLLPIQKVLNGNGFGGVL